MTSQSGVNTRIMKEVDKADISKAHRDFLKDILAIELDNLDKERERPRYIEDYKKAFYKRFGG